MCSAQCSCSECSHDEEWGSYTKSLTDKWDVQWLDQHLKVPNLPLNVSPAGSKWVLFLNIHLLCPSAWIELQQHWDTFTLEWALHILITSDPQTPDNNKRFVFHFDLQAVLMFQRLLSSWFGHIMDDLLYVRSDWNSVDNMYRTAIYVTLWSDCERTITDVWTTERANHLLTFHTACLFRSNIKCVIVMSCTFNVC